MTEHDGTHGEGGDRSVHDERDRAAGEHATTTALCEQHRRLGLAINEEIWNGRRFERIPDYFTEDFVADYSPRVIRRGHREIEEMVRTAHATFEGFREEVHLVVLALWAVTVGTNMAGYTPVFGEEVRFVLLGGQEISPETLLRWYVLHVLFLPFIIVIFMAIHFWRVRKDGGISGPL